PPVASDSNKLSAQNALLKCCEGTVRSGDPLLSLREGLFRVCSQCRQAKPNVLDAQLGRLQRLSQCWLPTPSGGRPHIIGAVPAGGPQHVVKTQAHQQARK